MASVHSHATAPVSNVRQVSKSVERFVLTTFAEQAGDRYIAKPDGDHEQAGSPAPAPKRRRRAQSEYDKKTRNWDIRVAALLMRGLSICAAAKKLGSHQLNVLRASRRIKFAIGNQYGDLKGRAHNLTDEQLIEQLGNLYHVRSFEDDFAWAAQVAAEYEAARSGRNVVGSMPAEKAVTNGIA